MAARRRRPRGHALQPGDAPRHPRRPRRAPAWRPHDGRLRAPPRRPVLRRGGGLRRLRRRGRAARGRGARRPGLSLRRHQHRPGLPRARGLPAPRARERLRRPADGGARGCLRQGAVGLRGEEARARGRARGGVGEEPVPVHAAPHPHGERRAGPLPPPRALPLADARRRPRPPSRRRRPRDTPRLLRVGGEGDPRAAGPRGHLRAGVQPRPGRDADAARAADPGGGAARGAGAARGRSGRARSGRRPRPAAAVAFQRELDVIPRPGAGEGGARLPPRAARLLPGQDRDELLRPSPRRPAARVRVTEPPS